MVSAKPNDQYEAMASIDVGNYENRRLEGMLNIPIIGDQLDLRVAGEWTKRDGYTFDDAINKSVDGRDLWSGRVSLLIHPIEKLSGTLVWEHFSEDDDRMRSAKQLCERDSGPSVVDGPAGPQIPIQTATREISASLGLARDACRARFIRRSAYQTPNAGANPFIAAGYLFGLTNATADPYAGVSQSPDLRVISSALEPRYRARNDTVEFNADFDITPELKLTSLTGYNKDSLYSTEDANRFNSASGVFKDTTSTLGGTLVGTDLQYCDPQLGCSDKFIGMDVSQEHAEQFSQELHLSSNFSGPFNFSVGANYLHYHTVEDYYVFYNAISVFAEYINSEFGGTPLPPTDATHDPAHVAFDPQIANSCGPLPATPELVPTSFLGLGCSYIDPNPLSQIDGEGHNYFRSENPYRLNSWAGFGEAYYDVTSDVKLTAGVRWTDDQKSFTEIPSWALVIGKGYPVAGIVDQQWKEWTGRFVANWTPKLDFTDQSLFYASYSRGYKGGGANPPGVTPIITITGNSASSPTDTTHPLTFEPEFVNAFELGTKNTLLDGSLTLNGDVFLYGYQELPDFPDRRPHIGQPEFRCPCQRRRTGSDMGALARLAVQFRGRSMKMQRSTTGKAQSI